MTKLQAIFHFPVNDLFVDAEMLGSQGDFSFEGNPVFIRLPKSNKEFDDSLPSYEGAPLFITGGYMAPEGGYAQAKVAIVKVGVWFDTDFEVPLTPHTEAHTRVAGMMFELHGVAQRALKAYLDDVAVRHGQFWLGLQAELPEATWISDVYHEGGTSAKVGGGTATRAVMYPREASLSATAQSAALERVTDGVGVPLPESFLRDARALQLRHTDLAQALLYAAIACELKVKQALMRLASDEQSQLVDAIIGKSREFALAAVALYDKGCGAVVGQSLRTHNKELYKELTELFTARNRLAHTGETPDFATVAKHVSTAKAAIEWLDSLG